MREVAYSIRELVAMIARAVDVEGALILGGIAVLAIVAGSVDLRLGWLVVAAAMIVVGIGFARGPRPPDGPPTSGGATR